MAALRIAIGEIATRDYLRGELERLRADLEDGGQSSREDAAKKREKAAKKRKAKPVKVGSSKDVLDDRRGRSPPCGSIRRVPTILLLTAETLSHEDHETAAVALELAALGVDSLFLPWTDPGVLESGADLALIRSTWDYTTRLPDFLSFLAELPMPVVNPVEVVRWNCHKGYLTTLAAAGVPVVPTALVRGDAAPELPDFRSAEIIVKPASSAGARGVGRFASSSIAAVDHLRALLTVGDALVQPFLPDVIDGERSLIFLGGRYSHAVRKTPATGDFRVQEQYGGVIVPHLASAAESAAALAALDAAPGGAAGLVYARVDLVGPVEAPLVMELELIEPELFLPHAPGSAATLARAVAALL